MYPSADDIARYRKIENAGLITLQLFRKAIAAVT